MLPIILRQQCPVSSPQQLQYAQNCGSGIRTSTLDRPMFVCIFLKWLQAIGLSIIGIKN